MSEHTLASGLRDVTCLLVLQLVTSGISRGSIASALRVSRRTVNGYLLRAYALLEEHEVPA
jgi:DNA-binding NarL/FixJ family response regulator